jgi:hypothetical protein
LSCLHMINFMNRHRLKKDEKPNRINRHDLYQALKFMFIRQVVNYPTL